MTTHAESNWLETLNANGAWRDIPCAHCGATPDEDCHTPTGTPTPQPHTRRLLDTQTITRTPRHIDRQREQRRIHAAAQAARPTTDRMAAARQALERTYRDVQPCGTEAAYRRHYRAGEDCAKCRAAHHAYNRQRRQAP